ncbi:MAG: CBS domain-containing protein [Chitinophagales bacterium]
MIYKRHAKDFMTSSVIVADAHSTFDQVMEFFLEHKIQHLPVADDDGNLIGIVSIKDMLKYMHKAVAHGKVTDLPSYQDHFDITKVMTANPVDVSPDAPQKDVLQILSEGKFQAVPVVEGKRIKGIITNKDITRIYHYDATHIIP